MTDRADVIVIGAGHNGLVTAAYLARAGLTVTCVEAADRAGGMAAARSLPGGYHFPGLTHTAYPIAPDIRKQLKLDSYGYAPGAAVSTLSLSAAGHHLRLFDNDISGADISVSDQSAYVEFYAQYRQFAKALRPLMNNKAPRLKDMDRKDKATLLKLGWDLRIGLGRQSMYEFLRVAAINIYDVLNETFDDEQLKAAIAVDAVMGHAMGPRSPGTVLTWLQRLQSASNGPLSIQTGELIDALYQSAEDAGVAFTFDAQVAEILIENNQAIGVELADGNRLMAATVVSNADPRLTFEHLVGLKRMDAMFANRVTQIRGSGVVAKLHIALRQLPSFRGLNKDDLSQRLLIAPSMRYIESAFNHSKYNECSTKPVLEITFPSLRNPSLAPDGHHTMSVTIAYVPYEIALGLEDARRTLVQQIIRQLSDYSADLASKTIDHELLLPVDIEHDYHAVEGHWHHGEMTIHQSFMMRPLYDAAQYDTPVTGLFLCGAGNHPGGGLTGMPGRNAARRVLQMTDAGR